MMSSQAERCFYCGSEGNIRIETYRKILVIQTAFLGDVILTTPLVRALGEHFRDSEIDVVTIPQTAAVFTHEPAVRDVLTFDKRKPMKKIFSFMKLVAAMKNHHYDLAVSIQSSLTSSVLMVLGRIPHRLGFARQKLLTIPVTHQKGMHMRDRYLSLMNPFTSAVFDRQTRLYFSEKERDRARRLFENSRTDRRRFIGLAPGSVWRTKRWPREYFVELLRQLEHEDIRAFLIGGKEDRDLCQDIILTSRSSAVNVAGELSILESAALIEMLDLMVSNDSAPLHMANAVQTDVIALFGPTVRRFGCYPYQEHDRILEIDLYCRPCSKHGGDHCPEQHFRCMKEITPAMVLETIKQHLKEHRAKLR